jgi:glyoxylase-like metal-dependent hydrolase (beta-lactamase superfamily II)
MNGQLYLRQAEIGQLLNFNYLIGDHRKKELAVVDPADDTDTLLDIAEKEHFMITAILLTHGHYDHVGGVPGLVKKLSIPVYLSKFEAPYYTPDCSELRRTGDREVIHIGDIAIECLHTPGHTPGGQCFLAQGNLMTGDTLFIDAVGRTDFPGGNAAELYESLQKIKTLPDRTMIWPGHNYGQQPNATLGELKVSNPFLACRTMNDFLDMTG